jgi:hypothetical protein
MLRIVGGAGGKVRAGRSEVRSERTRDASVGEFLEFLDRMAIQSNGMVRSRSE